MTTDISQFGNREKLMSADLLKALANNGWPNDFDLEGVILCIDENWGDVYLTNSSDQFVALTDSGKIESYYFSPYEGKKGFFEDLLGEYDDMQPEDQKWFEEIAERLGRLDELQEIE